MQKVLNNDIKPRSRAINFVVHKLLYVKDESYVVCILSSSQLCKFMYTKKPIVKFLGCIMPPNDVDGPDILNIDNSLKAVGNNKNGK